MPAVLFVVGKALSYAGARRLVKDPADQEAAYLFHTGSNIRIPGSVCCALLLRHSLHAAAIGVVCERQLCGIVAGGMRCPNVR